MRARNEPCPCGSGRKYKHCCQASDRAAGRLAGQRAALRAGAEAGEWQADALPVLIRIEEDDAPRPVVILVVAGDVILHHRMVGLLAGGADAVATAIERSVVLAAREVGAYPESVLVRHSDVGAALHDALAARQITVHARSELPELESAARGLMEALAGEARWPPVSMTADWRGWGLPTALVSDLFKAARHFWQREPWHTVANMQTPHADTSSGRQWTVCVLGNGGEEFGLALYSDRADLHQVARNTESGDGFSLVRGRIIALTYEAAAQVPQQVARVARAARWEWAGPRAYPVLMTVNTPGGGVSVEDAEDLVALLFAVPEFAEAHASALVDEDRSGVPCRPLVWTSAERAVKLRYSGEGVAHSFGPDDVMSELRGEIDTWVQAAADEFGEDVAPEAALARVNDMLHLRSVGYNSAPQPALGGLAPTQVHRLLLDWEQADAGIRVRRDLSLGELMGVDAHAHALTLLTLADEQSGLGATQAGNLQIAVVAALLERIRLDSDYRAALHAVKSRITEQDVSPIHEARVLCELGGFLRRRKNRFEVTRKGRDRLGSADPGTLYAELFETCFRKFNLSYNTRWEWPELQHQAAYTLYRLGRVAQRGRSAEQLVREAVLPYALERAPSNTYVDAAGWSFEQQILRRLVRFGQLERSSPASEASGGSLYRVTPLYDRVLEFRL